MFLWLENLELFLRFRVSKQGLFLTAINKDAGDLRLVVVLKKLLPGT